MQLYKRSGVYQVTYQSDGGKQVRRSLKTSDKRIAKEKCAKLELESHEQRLFGREPSRSFKELIVNYLEAKQQTRGFSRLQHACKPLLGYFGDSDITKLDETHVEGYVRWRSKYVSGSTVRREVAVLSASFNYARSKRKWRIKNPCADADLPRESKGRIRYLTHEEARQLLRVAESPIDAQGKSLSKQYKSPALRDFIELALYTGCRKNELLGLKWEDVDFTTRLIYLKKTKSGESQVIPISEEARPVLVRRLHLRNEVCPETPWVFFHVTAASRFKVGDRIKDVKKSFQTACRRAGIDDFRIHDLRHTFASWLVMNGVPLFEVSKLLRHSCIQMTERYAHLGPDHLHNAVANLGFSAHFQHTEIPGRAVVTRNGGNTN